MTPTPWRRPSGEEFEVVFGTALFKFRTPEAMLHVMCSRVPMAKGCADCGVKDCGSEDCEFAMSWPRAPSIRV
eukprot:15482655-Alexandrium_andersonii.AAC.1